MKQKNKAVTLHEVRLLFENQFPELLARAVDSPDEASFRQKIDAYLSDASWNAEGVRVVRRFWSMTAGSFMNFRSGKT